MTGMKNLDAMRELDMHMSNADQSIDDGLAEALRAEPGKVCAQHAAWNFCGYTYFEDGQYRTQVWVRGTPRETVSAPTLDALMTITNDKYGWD